jgi:hypothetical protein
VSNTYDDVIPIAEYFRKIFCNDRLILDDENPRPEIPHFGLRSARFVHGKRIKTNQTAATLPEFQGGFVEDCTSNAREHRRPGRGDVATTVAGASGRLSRGFGHLAVRRG